MNIKKRVTIKRGLRDTRRVFTVLTGNCCKCYTYTRTPRWRNLHKHICREGDYRVELLCICQRLRPRWRRRGRPHCIYVHVDDKELYIIFSLAMYFFRYVHIIWIYIVLVRARTAITFKLCLKIEINHKSGGLYFVRRVLWEVRQPGHTCINVQWYISCMYKSTNFKYHILLMIKWWLIKS